MDLPGHRWLRGSSWIERQLRLANCFCHRPLQQLQTIETVLLRVLRAPGTSSVWMCDSEGLSRKELIRKPRASASILAASPTGIPPGRRLRLPTGIGRTSDTGVRPHLTNRETLQGFRNALLFGLNPRPYVVSSPWMFFFSCRTVVYLVWLRLRMNSGERGGGQPILFMSLGSGLVLMF